MGTKDDGWAINMSMLDNLRDILRNHQRHLIAHPDPADPWWFLADPNTEDSPWEH